MAECNSIGLYIHVPFCARRCEYCAFYKERADRGKIELYLNTIEEELAEFPAPGPISTVFMGGGTPTLLSAEDLERLCGMIKKFAPSPIEWSIECAPSTLKKEKLEVLKKWGVNRFSLGVQSFNPKTLEAIGRPHNLKQIEEAISLLKNETQNWNLDLIFAAAESTLGDWIKDLEKAVSLGSKHISTYCLTFESDTEMFLKMLKGSKKKPSPEEEARFYKETWVFLRSNGFHHYELANFARPGFECIHNLNTWNMNEWVGYGPSAASQYNLKRYTNVPDLDAWAKGVRSGRQKLVDQQSLNQKELAMDAIIFGLRMPEGIDLNEIQKRFGELDSQKLKQFSKELEEEGLLIISGPKWRLSDDGLLVADRVGAEALERFC